MVTARKYSGFMQKGCHLLVCDYNAHRNARSLGDESEGSPAMPVAVCTSCSNLRQHGYGTVPTRVTALLIFGLNASDQYTALSDIRRYDKSRAARLNDSDIQSPISQVFGITELDSSLLP